MSRNNNYYAKSPAVMGIFIAMAAVFQVVEGFFPRPLPFLRLGLGNIAVLVALITMGSAFAFKVFLGKVLIGSFLLGTFLSPAFYLSFSGGFAAWALMSLLYRPLGRLSPVGVSILGAVAHGMSQGAVAYFLLIKHPSIFYLIPLLLLSSSVAGWITGLIARAVVPEIAVYADRKIYLASTSERRINILKSRGIPVVVIPPGVKEESPSITDKPDEFALRQAEKKLASVFKILPPPGFVISADTVVSCEGKIYGKPENSKKAAEMMLNLSSKVQQVYTAVIVENLCNGHREKRVIKTELKLKKIPEDEIEKLSDKNIDKAGGYALQGLKDKYIKWIKGSYVNAVGFPVREVASMLKKTG